MSSMMDALKQSSGNILCSQCGGSIPVGSGSCPYCGIVVSTDKNKDKPKKIYPINKIGEWMFQNPSGIQDIYLELYRFLVKEGNLLAKAQYGADMMDDQLISTLAEACMIEELSRCDKSNPEANKYLNSILNVFDYYYMKDCIANPVFMGFMMSCENLLNQGLVNINYMTYGKLRSICYSLYHLFLGTYEFCILAQQGPDDCTGDYYVRKIDDVWYMFIAREYAPMFKKKYMTSFEFPEKTFCVLTHEKVKRAFIQNMFAYMNRHEGEQFKLMGSELMRANGMAYYALKSILKFEFTSKDIWVPDSVPENSIFDIPLFTRENIRDEYSLDSDINHIY